MNPKPDHNQALTAALLAINETMMPFIDYAKGVIAQLTAAGYSHEDASRIAAEVVIPCIRVALKDVGR